MVCGPIARSPDGGPAGVSGTIVIAIRHSLSLYPPSFQKKSSSKVVSEHVLRSHVVLKNTEKGGTPHDPGPSSALKHLYPARARLGTGTLGPPSEVSEQLHRLRAGQLGICPRWNVSPRGSARASRSGCPLLGAHPIERSERPSRTLPPETGSP